MELLFVPTPLLYDKETLADHRTREKRQGFAFLAGGFRKKQNAALFALCSEQGGVCLTYARRGAGG